MGWKKKNIIFFLKVFGGKTGTPSMRLLGKHFAREGRIEPAAARKLLRDCSALLKEVFAFLFACFDLTWLFQEPNCLEIEAPCHIFGDIHGQLFDFLVRRMV